MPVSWYSRSATEPKGITRYMYHTYVFLLLFPEYMLRRLLPQSQYQSPENDVARSFSRLVVLSEESRDDPLEPERNLSNQYKFVFYDIKY